MIIAFIGLSDTVQGAIIVGITGMVTLVGSHFLRRGDRQAEIEARQEEQRADRMEWYRHTLFDKRLQAISEAYGRGMEIHRLRSASRDDGPLWLELVATCNRGRDWYHSNAVYLNVDLPTSSNFIGVLNAAPDASGNSDFEKVFSEFLKELRERTQELLAPVREDG